MVTRLLAYDPDRVGRRMIQEAAAILGPAYSLLVRTNPVSCVRELQGGRVDGLLLGLPAAGEDLAQLFLCCQRLETPPAIFLVGGDASGDESSPVASRVEKTAAGLAQLMCEVPSSLRARRLGHLAGRLDQVALGVQGEDPETGLAGCVVGELEQLGLRALLLHVDPNTGRLAVQAGRYSPEVVQDFTTAIFTPFTSTQDGETPASRLAAMVSGRRSIYTEDPLELLRRHPMTTPEAAARVQRDMALEALYLAPIETRGEIGALLAVGERLTEGECQALDRLIPPLAEALEHAQALHQASRQAKALRALQQVSLIINATLDPEELLDQVLELLATVVPFDSACVLMSSGKDFRVRAARGYKAFSGIPAVGYTLHVQDYPNVQRLWTTGLSVLVSNTEQEPEWRASGLSAHVRSWLGVPIQRRGETIGLLSLDSTTPGFFQDFRVEIATAFARQMGVALDNADLFERERHTSRQNRLLQELAGVINSTPDIQSILDHLARYAAEALEVTRASVALLSSPGAQLEAISLFDPSRSVPAGVWESWRGNTIALRDVMEPEGAPPLDRPRVLRAAALAALGPWVEATRLKSAVIAPIYREGALLGLLGMDEPGEERDFSEEALALAAALAEHAAVAIHNARAFSNVRRQSEELASLFNLGIALSHELTAEGVVDLLLDQVDRLLEVDSAVVARFESPDRLYCDVLDAGRRLPALSVPLRGPSLSGHVIRTGEPLLINDYDAEIGSLPVPGLTTGVPTASWLGVPLTARGETIGAVSVQSETPYRFSDDHLRLLRMIANQIAIALDNARLLQTAAHRAEELRLVNEIGRYAVSVLDIQHLAREVAVRILRSFHYYSVQVLLVEAGRLVPQAVVRAPEAEHLEIARTISLRDATIMTTVANSGKPWLVRDVSSESRYLSIPQLPLTRCELAVPLMIGGEVVGVLDVQSDREGGLSDADLELLQVLAAQVAISIANARLFAEVRAHAAQLEARVTARTAEIRSQKERTEAILRSVADAVLVLDLEGQLVLTNPVAQGLLEGPRASDLLSAIGRLHSQGGVVSEPLELGEMTFHALASPVTLGELAVGTVIVLRDITRLRELDRLKSQFVATVSHELRTPLANIKLYLSLLRKGREDRREQYLQVLDQETGSLGEMIEDLLDLSRLESHPEVEERQPVGLEELLAQLVENHRPLFQDKGLDVQFEGYGPAVVPANRNQMIQVFTNLLSNAMHYTPSGGKVRVRLQDAEQVDGKPMASVAVQDSGQGIPDEDMPYIFERFYRGTLARNNRIPGSGLGLAIVHEILERHGGQIRVTSRLGEGSTFTVLLPLDQESRG